MEQLFQVRDRTDEGAWWSAVAPTPCHIFPKWLYVATNNNDPLDTSEFTKLLHDEKKEELMCRHFCRISLQVEDVWLPHIFRYTDLLPAIQVLILLIS